MKECALTPNFRRELWPKALLWLLFLGPYFFLTYGQVNQFTATRSDVATLVFGWESAIPFWPWTIVPYWSIDLLYGISLFVCTSRRELWIHGCRLALASTVACLGFLLFPLRFSFVRPASDGAFGWLFAQLELFDLPYNQAPSLHIILLWLLWLRFYPHVAPRWRWLLHGWFGLIGVSVLTTWQHHAIDVVTGLFVGMIISYALPMAKTWRWRPSRDPFARRLAGYYAIGSAACALFAVFLSGAGWLLLWPAFALLMVALGYCGLGDAVFQKNRQGRASPSARILLAPYWAGAWISFRYFSAKYSVSSDVTQVVALGSYPRGRVGASAVLDMTSEWPRSRHVAHLPYIACPQMDLLAPSVEELQRAVLALNQLQDRGKVLVHCALGLSRSATVVAAWLVQQGNAESITQAVAQVQRARPGVILRESHVEALTQWSLKYINKEPT
ncbi:hypothetical protein SOASR030_03040 [Leminorella grimontii]|uniref:Tyrosine specific protein phosphatases domain-containing protein n=1 Tax=Leminorella grimontii TaxID=82981 RepID=A0AAV5N0K0_9GAMM|nr:phosphatase PAP2/dual specificity phosphatase family protein [Leminorella grimontii]KFC95629.1 Ser/Thr and Tyr protein phosphatase [Leminorella grimontii ATCC 33999 = DSM 5078]GKX54192.1 hypothetical protein SOASR030_03040 [Leminorella grimontii]VFS59817.1 Predicted protein tyrosine phosphatase [Leminorella grimontii]